MRRALLSVRLICAIWAFLLITSRTASAQNRVLELDGQSGKVELPPKVFWGLKEFTLETWVKPAQFGRSTILAWIPTLLLAAQLSTPVYSQPASALAGSVLALDNSPQQSIVVQAIQVARPDGSNLPGDASTANGRLPSNTSTVT